MTLNLTSDQINAYNRLVKFIKNDDEHELLLIGNAGTGKTTLIAKFINDMIKNKKCKKISIASPTHKALGIVKSKLFENATEDIIKKVEITTIHSLLLYNSYVNDKGIKYFAMGKNKPNFSKYNIVIIDECSMLSNQIINDINTQKMVTKLLYVGDMGQLPPVCQQDSEIFKKNIEIIKLEEIVRTKNNIIQEISQSHRSWIFDLTKMPNLSKYICEDIRAEMYKNKNLWLDKFVNIIKSTGKMNADNCIILTWTNKRCDEYNKYIREKLFNKTNLQQYEVNEILIMDDHHKIKDVSFYSSEKIKIVSVSEIEIKFMKFKEINTTDETVLPSKIIKLIVSFIDNVNKLLENKLSVYSLNVNKLTDILNNVIDAPVYNICVMKSHDKYDEIQKKFYETIQNLQYETHKIISKLKLDDNEKTNCFAEINKKINAFWKKWNENVVDKIANVNYAYVITTHKSQGSSFQNIFIDVDDILSNTNKKESLKCLYTAITRAILTIDFLLP